MLSRSVYTWYNPSQNPCTLCGNQASALSSWGQTVSGEELLEPPLSPLSNPDCFCRQYLMIWHQRHAILIYSFSFMPFAVSCISDVVPGIDEEKASFTRISSVTVLCNAMKTQLPVQNQAAQSFPLFSPGCFICHTLSLIVFRSLEDRTGFIFRISSLSLSVMKTTEGRLIF